MRVLRSRLVPLFRTSLEAFAGCMSSLAFQTVQLTGSCGAVPSERCTTALAVETTSGNRKTAYMRAFGAVSAGWEESAERSWNLTQTMGFGKIP